MPRMKRKVGSDGKADSTHYGGADNPYEAIKVIEAWGYDKDFYIGTLLRYICRQGKKSGNLPIRDLEKALWYLARKIDNLKKELTPRRRMAMTEKSLGRALRATGLLRKGERLHANIK